MKIREKRTVCNNGNNAVNPSLSTLHFNLRSPKSLTHTQLYAILYIRYKEGGSKQFKLPLQCKLLPSNWDKKRETVKLNGTENETTISQLNQILTIIYNVNLFFSNFFYIFTTSSIDDKELINKIKEEINKNSMNKDNLLKNRGVTASTVIKKAFTEMYESGTKKESTVKVNRYKLDAFLKFLKSGKVTDSAKHRLTIEGLNEYRKYIHDTNPSISKKQSYKHIEFIISLINHAVSNRTKDIGISQIQTDGFVKTDVIRDCKIDNKHIEIRANELEALKSLTLSTKRERDTRDLFIFGCTIGCRYSDLYQITQKNFTIKETDEGKVLVYETQKGQSKHITAYVPFSINPIISETIDRINSYDYDISSNSSYFSTILKKIFEKANLRRSIKYKDANGAESTKDLCFVVSSHDMRVTGATQLLRKFEDVQFVVRVCGWTDDKMIREVYGRLTIDDEAKLQSKRIKKASETTTKVYDEIEDMRKALVYLGADYADVCDITSIADLYVKAKEYEGVLLDKGVDYKIVKEIYNENITLKERITKLNSVCVEALKTVR